MMRTYFSIIVLVACVNLVFAQEPIEIALNPPPSFDECLSIDELESQWKPDVENNYSIYKDYYKFKLYDEGFQFWQEAFYRAPRANGKMKAQFDDGVGFHKIFLDRATEKADKERHVRAILAILDKQMECYPEDSAIVYGKKGFQGYYYLRGYVTEDEVFENFKKAFDLSGETVDYFILNPFSRMIYDRVLSEQMPIEEGRSYVMNILGAIDKNLEECEDQSCEGWEAIADYVPGLFENLEGIQGFYSCEYFIDKYYALYESNKEDCEITNDVYLRLVSGNCTDDNAAFTSVRLAKEKNCFVPPPPDGPLKKGYKALNEGSFKEAIGFYDEYLETSADAEKMAEIELRVAKIYYAHLRNYSKARQYARKAIEHNQNWGAPYILIGKLYASSGPLCGSGRGWESQVVTWAAIDKWQQAKQADPTYAEEADRLIKQYRKYMPSQEDIFMRNIKEGSTFKVPCWIQENTKVRAAS